MKNVFDEIKEREATSSNVPILLVCLGVAIFVPWALPITLKIIVVTAILYALIKVLKALLG